MSTEEKRQLNNFIFRTISLAQRNGTQRNMCAYFVPKYAMHVFLQTFGLFMCRLTPQIRHAELVWLLFPKSIDFVENVWFSTASHEPRKVVVVC